MADRINGADLIVRSFPIAVSLWQKDIRLLDGVHKLEAIRIGAKVLIVHTYPNGDGWQVYRPVTDNGRIDATLAAIAMYCDTGIVLDDGTARILLDEVTARG